MDKSLWLFHGDKWLRVSHGFGRVFRNSVFSVAKHVEWVPTSQHDLFCHIRRHTSGDDSDCNNALGRVPMAKKFNIGMDADIFTACSNSLTIGGFHQRNPRALSLAYATAGYLNHYRFTSQFWGLEVPRFVPPNSVSQFLIVD